MIVLDGNRRKEMGRKYTRMLLDMVDNDALSAVVALEAALGYMSELQVEDMMRMNGFLLAKEEYEDEDEDEDEDDGQPNEAQEWHDFDPDC
jgi:hypothetical protein